MRKIRGIGAVAAAVALLTLLPAIVAAQDPRPPAGQTLAGEVKDVNPLRVEVQGTEYLLATAPDVVVNRDGKQVNLGELNRGDKVTFTTNPDGTVSRMDVTDAATDERTWLLIGLAVLAALVVAGLVWYLTQRRNRDRVAYRDGGTTVASHR